MPVLKISDGQGDLLDGFCAPMPAFEAFLRIWVLTHLPDEPDLSVAKEVVLTRTARSMKQDLKATLRLDLLERILKDQQDVRHRLTAYFIMAVNLACSVHHPELVGYRRAGLATGRSLSTVRRAWRRFSPVAHLLVAPSFHPHDGVQASKDWLLEMLAYGEEIRRHGENLIPHGQDKPLLDPAKTWTCPPDLVLPSVHLQIEPLSENILRSLRNANR